jgi:hypothetical protein
MKPRMVVLLGLLAAGCGAAGAGATGTATPEYDPYAPTPPTPPPVATPPPTTSPPTSPTGDGAVTPPIAAAPAQPNDPVRERAAQLREAADLLDKAAAARDRAARSFSEQLFSSAELILGPDPVAELAPLFREGAPPRVTTPPRKVGADTAPLPEVEGNSERERPAPPTPRKGTLAGTLTLEGKPLSGEFGVVTLEPLDRKPLPPIPTARMMEQRGRKFAPRVLVIPTGSVVTFPNFDPYFHNVFSTSAAKPFDLGLYRTNEAREIQFDREGTVRVGCNLHANMAAYIVVVSAPHYMTTDAAGRFTFKSVEPGRYLLRAYSERTTRPITQEVAVKRGRNEVTIGVTADAPSGPLPDKFGVPRGGKAP